MSSSTVLSTSDLADSNPSLVQGFDSPFKSYGGRRAFQGSIETVQCFEDAGAIRECLAEPGLGRVLIADAGGSRRVAVLGDKMARLGMENGWAGVIVNGAVRDCETLSQLDFGVLALGAVPVRGGLQGEGKRGADLTIDEIPFLVGTYVYVDADGILLSDEALKSDITTDRGDCIPS
ncbi:ribonuclease E activity regulator RraA (plasmid) [Cupriavidus necator]|nr:ribonuclease E activity regulator RraA [Cupriavidus necator]QQX89670.1 ribonuclease E activity regulator RraA [Cupriavidus necator]